jgi:hypothetical protein
MTRSVARPDFEIRGIGLGCRGQPHGLSAPEFAATVGRSQTGSRSNSAQICSIECPVPAYPTCVRSGGRAAPSTAVLVDHVLKTDAAIAAVNFQSRKYHPVNRCPDQTEPRCVLAENVRILPPISAHFVRSHRLRPDSAKTYGNLVHGTACRNTDEFPVPVTAALIGGWTKSLRDSRKVTDASAVCARPAASLNGSREKHPVA